MVVTYQKEDGLWTAIAYNDQGFIVDATSQNQTTAVDIAIDKSHERLLEFGGYRVERESESSKEQNVMYWHKGNEQGESRDKYYAHILLSISGEKNNISGNGLTLENALEHVALKIRHLNLM